MTDAELIRSWWATLSDQIPTNVAGLWFGMTDLAVSDQAVRHLYVAGCPAFDASDPSAEWATDYTWWPDDRYVLLPGLAAALDSVALEQARALVAGLGVPSAVGVAVGFDDGDFALVQGGST